MKQSFIEIFENKNENITIRYGLDNGSQTIDVQMLEIRRCDLENIIDGLDGMIYIKGANHEVV